MSGFVCECGEVFDAQVWHCGICAHHWLLNVAECRNCHKGKRTMNGLTKDAGKKIALIERGRNALAQAKTVPEAKEVRDQAAAAEKYFRSKRVEQVAASEAELYAAELRLDAERLLGKMLQGMEKAKGGQPYQRKPTGSTVQPVNGHKLADLGITKGDSHRWQQVASVPEEKYQEHKERAKEEGDRRSLTTTAIMRTAKEQQREAVREENRELVRESVPLEKIKGPFSCIVADPPWDWGDEGDVDHFGRGRPVYKTESFDELLTRGVADLADKNCHLYLWITNRSLPKGFAILEAWGFRYVTCLTWCKPSIGMGNYYRGSTEQILFGVRGSLSLLRSDVGTWFAAARPGRHSAKPKEFYNLVESCSPGPWLEMFGREPRKGWVVWGAEV